MSYLQLCLKTLRVFLSVQVNEVLENMNLNILKLCITYMYVCVYACTHALYMANNWQNTWLP